MTIQELSKIMVEHNLSIRAIPEKVREVYVKDAEEHGISGGKVEFLPDYKREMYVKYIIPEDAGKFMCIKNEATLAMVNFSKAKRFNTIEEAVEDYLANLKEE